MKAEMKCPKCGKLYEISFLHMVIIAVDCEGCGIKNVFFNIDLIPRTMDNMGLSCTNKAEQASGPK